MTNVRNACIAIKISVKAFMKNTFLLLSSLMMFSLSSVAQEDFNEGLRWYTQRNSGAIGMEAKPEHIEKAIVHFKRAYEQGEHLPESGIYLMRSYNFKSRFTMTSTTDQRKTYQLAKEIGDVLVQKYPLNAELRFEYVAAIGSWGEVMGIFRAAKEGVADKLKVQMEALIKLDPEFRNAIGERSLAVLNLRVPRIPFIISWPDKKRAVELTADIIRRYPNDLGNNVSHAEALAENGRKNEAIQYLQRALTIQPHEENLLEDLHFHVEAKKMLEKLKGN